MVGSQKGGKNYKKYKYESAVSTTNVKKNVSKDDFDGGIYAKVQQMLGGGRLLALGEDKKVYNCVIRGRLYKKVWIVKDDYLVILGRDYEKGNNADVLHKLSDVEVSEYDVKELFIVEDENKDDIVFDTENHTIDELIDKL